MVKKLRNRRAGAAVYWEAGARASSQYLDCQLDGRETGPPAAREIAT